MSIPTQGDTPSKEDAVKKIQEVSDAIVSAPAMDEKRMVKILKKLRRIERSVTQEI
jgi:hypothetical protein